MSRDLNVLSLVSIMQLSDMPPVRHSLIGPVQWIVSEGRVGAGHVTLACIYIVYLCGNILSNT